jgi:hypothetical protein
MDNLVVPLNHSAPFPEIVTVWNAIISEYSYVKQMTQSPKFPEVNLANYMKALAFGIEQLKDPDHREEMRTMLAARGWKPHEVPTLPSLEPLDTVESGLPETQAQDVESFSVNAVEFQSPEDALDYALRHPRKRADASDHETLIRGVARR